MRGSPPATVPATARWCPSRTSDDSVSCAAKAPASGVLRSMTVMPRALARAPALTRLTRSVVEVSSRPRSTAAVSGDASCSASSPAISSVSVRTPPRESCAKNRPRISASGRYGAIARAVSGVSSGALTAYRALRPSSTSRTWAATSSDTRTWASAVEAPRCGVSSVFGASRSGDPVGGSCSNTSMPAPPRCPDVERLGDGRLVDHATASDVEDDRPGLELGDRLATDQPARRAREGHVHGDHVGPGEHRRRSRRAPRRGWPPARR